MALLPSANWNPAGTTPGGYMDPRVVIFHVTAGEGNARPHSGLEWHFEVSYSGEIEQGVDTNRQAAANYKANPFAISIETEGFGSGVWTAAQLDSLVLISEWCLDHHPRIKRQRCDRWDGSGFGYHVMFGAPGPWTPVAKSCPGPNRIRQFDEVLLPRLLNPSEEDDVREVIVWYRSDDGGEHAYRQSGIFGVWVPTLEQVDALKAFGVPEFAPKNTAQPPSMVVLYDGPCRNAARLAG